MTEEKFVAISLFSGAGGMDIGVAQAGFDVLCSITPLTKFAIYATIRAVIGDQTRGRTEMDIQIVRDGESVAVYTPYCRAFIDRARELGGRWDPSARAWRFDHRDETRVRGLVAEIFGDPDEPRVTVRINESGLIPAARVDSYFALGRCLFTRPSRDHAVTLGDGVVIVAGGFPARGGSSRYPEIGYADDGTIVEVRDVPLSIARAAVERDPSAYSIVDGTAERRLALESEAARLRARLAEIESELAALEGEK